MRDLVWKKKSLFLNESQVTFRRNANLSQEIMELDKPFRIFAYFFTNNIIDKIVQETNLYAVQKDPSSPVNVIDFDIRKYIGILIFMLVYH